MTSSTSTPGRARLALTPTPSPAGVPDGAWWPYSRDLAVELPLLVAALRDRIGRVTRVTTNPAPWSAAPHTLSTGGDTVHMGWLSGQDVDTMVLFSYTLGRCDLLVIPPGTEYASVTRLMVAASAPGNLRPSGVLMSDEESARRRRREVKAGEDVWETEGGPSPRPPLRPRPVSGARMIYLPRGGRHRT
ncbi:DUF5994 family protein [Streptomyces sp. NPDC097619]|uniref:DUF5994 family protein n=1 Tax=Streptomyces sp. NPDC097619 TaxID=3157228 RepID=UPI00332B7450